VFAEIRFCLFWIPLEIITHKSILPFSIEILHRQNGPLQPLVSQLSLTEESFPNSHELTLLPLC
jgi:hypothetical protein